MTSRPRSQPGSADDDLNCHRCNGDCAGANPPVYDCPMKCEHPWAMQDDIGRPYCAACGMAWHLARAALERRT